MPKREPSADDESIMDESEKISAKGKAAAMLSKTLKECVVIGRRARFSWRRMRAGVLVFKESREMGGGQRVFAIGKKLGEGGYSTIWLVHEWQPDGSERQYAVKRVLVNRSDPEQAAAVEHEVTVMRSLPPHPNLVELIGTCNRPLVGGAGGASSSQEEMYLLLELCRGGSLAELLIARAAEEAPLASSFVARTFRDMAMPLVLMHAQPRPLAHRDVKPENYILSDADGRWRLCDFGSTTADTFTYASGTSAHEVSTEEERIHKTSTPQYRAPEMCDLRRGETVGIAADVWALGVSLYKLLFLRDLFGAAGEERLGILNFDPAKKLTPDDCARLRGRRAAPDEGLGVLYDVLRACLTPSASARPPASSLLQMLTSRGALSGPRSPPGDAHHDAAGSEHAHLAGRLVISELQVRNLFPKSSSGGVKAYVLITSGGTRRVTPIAPKGQDASWSLTVVLSTHLLRSVELTVWAAHQRTAHDFLGVVTLQPLSLIGDATRPITLPQKWMALQRRSERSRVSGEICCALEWSPFTPPPAPPQPPSAPPPRPPPQQPATAPQQSGGAGSFWASEPAVATAVAVPPPPAGGGDFGDLLGGFGAESGFRSPNALPPSVRFEPSSERFEAMSTQAAPWDAAGMSGMAGVAASGDAGAVLGAGAFWASFDAAPVSPVSPVGNSRSATIAPPFPGGGLGQDFGGQFFADPSRDSCAPPQSAPVAPPAPPAAAGPGAFWDLQ